MVIYFTTIKTMKNRQRWKLVWMLIGVSFLCHAQPNFEYGPRLGLSFASFAGPDARNVSLPVGAFIGIFGTIHYNDRWALQPEIVYVTSGSEYHVHDTRFKISLGYITFPGLLDYHLGKQWHLQGGIQGALLLNAVTDKTTPDKKVQNSSSLNGFRRLDYGPVLGFVYAFPFGVDIGLRAFAGIPSIYTSSETKVHNVYAQFVLGYRFSNKKEYKD